MSAAVVVFVACALLCAVGHVAIVISVLGRRTGTADPAVPRPRFAAELVWALLPAVVLALVLTATWERVREQPAHRPGVMMKVAQ